MQKWTLLFTLAVAAFFILGAGTPERPKLGACGKYLPNDAQFSIVLEGSWDRREPTSYRFHLSYRNDDPDSTLQEDSEETKQFRQCVDAAIEM